MDSICRLGQPDFYPRPPRGGRRRSISVRASSVVFLSTPSARRATVAVCRQLLIERFLSTPSARRATADGARSIRSQQNFYPRPPRGGRRRKPGLGDKWFQISIHALREEGDQTDMTLAATLANFYPRPPRGGRPQTKRLVNADGTDFYPRPPRGGRR